jgi:putative transposase
MKIIFEKFIEAFTLFKSHSIVVAVIHFQHILIFCQLFLRYDIHHWIRNYHSFFRYSNLVKGIVVTRINQIWVSNITYLRIADRFAYLSLITDAFSRKIVGYYLHNTPRTIGPLNALQMAINNADLSTKQYLIHHSDRGLQYYSSDYITLLRNNFTAVSMTQNGDPYENAMAERINGILKIEFGLYVTFRNFTAVQTAVDTAVKNYNALRPHMSLQLKTPASVHL